ncbi:MAG TPA: carboxypeptidase regulatory-like domain-containing protein, partial [Gemmatimonadales bacterium]
MVRFLALCWGLVLGGSGTALAQTGALSGRVVSRESRAPLEAARVEVLGTTLAVTTDAAGSFSITGIPIGVYAARFSAVGYQPFTQTNLIIGSGKPYTVLVELDRRPLTLETIAVTAAPYFQPTLQAPSLGQALNAEEVRNAPGVQED